jgi:hypothetical protein
MKVAVGVGEGQACFSNTELLLLGSVHYGMVARIGIRNATVNPSVPPSF